MKNIRLFLITATLFIAMTIAGCSGSSTNTKQTESASESNTTPQSTMSESGTETESDSTPAAATPVSRHGQLSVVGTQLTDSNGDAFQLRGMSTHGLTWYPSFVSEDAFRTLRDDWNTNIVRLAMYVDEWNNDTCYMNNKDGSLEILEKGINLCIDLDMYVIIDWHVLNPGDPSAYTDEAIEFFEYITEKYADYPNIIYEICNEPNGDRIQWSSVIKPYAETIIPIIRERDSDAVIIVGTPTWSQDIDKALADPLEFDNVMYALHFYADTHKDWLRDRVESCVDKGLPVFVSEFGCCDASGNGINNFDETEKWLSMLDRRGISYCNWALANKDETCCAVKGSTDKVSDWSEDELSEGGNWIKEWFKKH